MTFHYKIFPERFFSENKGAKIFFTFMNQNAEPYDSISIEKDKSKKFLYVHNSGTKYFFLILEKIKRFILEYLQKENIMKEIRIVDIILFENLRCINITFIRKKKGKVLNTEAA